MPRSPPHSLISAPDYSRRATVYLSARSNTRQLEFADVLRVTGMLGRHCRVDF
jgi:hypothetical protein